MSMLTATLSVLNVDDPPGASVRIDADGLHVATYPVTSGDGDGPVPAANAVLGRHGWTADGWQQTFGGVAGSEWTAQVQQVEGGGA